MVNPQYSWEQAPKAKSFNQPPVQQPAQTQQPVPIPQNQANVQQEPQKNYSWNDAPVASTVQNLDDDLDWQVDRAIAGQTSRLIESLVGLPGDTMRFLSNISEIPGSLGIMGSLLPEKQKQQAKDFISNVTSASGGILGPELPTQKELQEFSEKATKGYTKPQNEAEKAVSESLVDVASTFTPGTGQFGWIKNFGIPIVSNLGKQVVKKLGYDDEKQNATKAGIWAITSLANSINPKNYAGSLVNEGKQAARASNAMSNAGRLDSSLERLLNQVFLTNDPRATAARTQINSIRQDIQNGRTSAHDLMNMYDSVNAAKRSKNLFADLTTGDRRQAAGNLNRVLDALDNEIQHSVAPDVYNRWREGINALATIYQSEGLVRRAQEFLTGPYAKAVQPGVAALFTGGAGASHYFGMGALSTVGSLAAAGGYKSGQVLYRVLANDTLRRYYLNAYTALLRNNSPAFILNINKLNKQYQEDEKKGLFKKPEKEQPKKEPRKPKSYLHRSKPKETATLI